MKKRTGPINVLFVSAHNSARSILAEALLNRMGAGRFEASSAGFTPASQISPYARAMLCRMPYNTGWVSAKPVEAHLDKRTAPFDFIIRLSPGEPAGGQWPVCRGGKPIVIDWFFNDPIETLTSMAPIARAYEEIYNTLASRIETLIQLPERMFQTGEVFAWLEQGEDVPLKMAS